MSDPAARNEQISETTETVVSSAAGPIRRRSSDHLARETLDAIRLALEAAADDRAAVQVIRVLLADGPAARPKDTASVARLLRAVKRMKHARWRLT